MKQPLNEQFRRMQKLAGIITENQYINEGTKKPLEGTELYVYNDIIKSLNEGDGWLDKLKSYAKKGAITIGILAALLSAANLSDSQKKDVVDVVKTETSAATPEQLEELEGMLLAYDAHDIYKKHKSQIDDLAKSNESIEGLVTYLKMWDNLNLDDKTFVGRAWKDDINNIKKTKF
jgi:hypothetical protein